MKPHFLLILALLAGLILAVPISAYTPAGGTFYYGGGVSTNQTNSAFSGGSDNGIYGIFFRSAAALPSLGAVKFYSVRGGEGWGAQSHPVNTTDNSSSLSASLRYSGTVVSTGTLYYSLSDVTGDIYIAYFVNTWSPAGIPDNSVLYLEYDRTKFNWRFSNVGKADGSEWQGNLISAGFTFTGPSVDPANIYMPYTSLGIYGHYVDYTDTWKLQYITVQKTDVSSYLDLIRNVDGVLYNSRVMVNETYNGANVTIYDEWNTIDTRISSINHDRDIYIIAWDPKLRMYSATFNLSSGYVPPPPLGYKYWIYTFDETTGNFLANTSVRLVNLTSGTAYNLLTNGYGMLRVSGIPGEFHTSRGSKTNYISSDWSNQTVSGDTAAVQLMLWPIGVPPAGNCTVYWKVYDGTTSPYQPISGATIRISDGSVLITDSAGTAQKNLLAWGNYTYSVEKTGFSGITRDLQPEGSTTFTQTIYLSKPAGVTPAPVQCISTDQCNTGYICEKNVCIHYDMNTEIGKLVDWIASTILTLGVLIWLTLTFTVIGMFMLALRSLGGGSGTLFQTGLFPKNLFGRGGRRR